MKKEYMTHEELREAVYEFAQNDMNAIRMDMRHIQTL